MSVLNSVELFKKSS